MKKFEFSSETMELFTQLESIEPLGACTKSCRDSFKSCLDGGGDRSECGETLRKCVLECRQSGRDLTSDKSEKIATLIEKIIKSVG